VERIRRGSYYLKQGSPEEAAAKRIGKSMWIDLFAALYLETHPDTNTSSEMQRVVSEAYRLKAALGKAGIR
jgi:hypothetical protein